MNICRVFYEFEKFEINGIPHYWDLCYLTDQKRWSCKLLYYGSCLISNYRQGIPLNSPRGHWMYKTIEQPSIKEIVNIFKTNEIKKLKTGSSLEYSVGLDYTIIK